MKAIPKSAHRWPKSAISVAGVDGVAPRLFGHGEQGVHIQIAVRRLGRADAHGVGGQLYVEGVRVGGGVHRHRVHPDLPAGTKDAHRDLAAVGDQHTLKHYTLRTRNRGAS